MILVTVEHARDHEITNRDQHIYNNKRLALEECCKTVRAVLKERLQAGKKSKTEDLMREFLENDALENAVELFGEFFTYPNFTLQEMKLDEEMPLYVKEPDSPKPWMDLSWDITSI